MAQKIYRVTATWDPEADVWVAMSDDVPGLVTEAATVEELEAHLRELVPELLRLNRVISGPEETVPIELTATRKETVLVPA